METVMNQIEALKFKNHTDVHEKVKKLFYLLVNSI